MGSNTRVFAIVLFLQWSGGLALAECPLGGCPQPMEWGSPSPGNFSFPNMNPESAFGPKTNFDSIPQMEQGFSNPPDHNLPQKIKAKAKAKVKSKHKKARAKKLSSPTTTLADDDGNETPRQKQFNYDEVLPLRNRKSSTRAKNYNREVTAIRHDGVGRSRRSSERLSAREVDEDENFENDPEKIALPEVEIEPLPHHQRQNLPAKLNLSIAADSWYSLPPGDSGTVYVNGRAMSATSQDIATFTHENCHGVNSEASKLYPGYEAVYVPNQGAILLPPTGIPRLAIADIVPRELRASRFNTYVQNKNGGLPDAGTWRGSGGSTDSDALYIWDEWSCYIAGSEALVEAVENGQAVENTDLIGAPIEMTTYAAAVLKAVHDKGDYAEYDKLKATFAFNVERMMNAVRTIGRSNEGGLYEHTRGPLFALTSDAGQSMMGFLSEEFGEDWVSKTFATDY